MTTPPGRPPADQSEGPAQGDRRAAGSGLAAPRPGGQAAPQSISAAAAADALTGAASGVEQGQVAGHTTAEQQLLGSGLSASAKLAVPTGSVLGQRGGLGQGQGELATVGRGSGHGQGAAQGGEGAAKLDGATAATSRGIGRRDREPDPEPAPEIAPPIISKPAPVARKVAVFGIRAGQLVAWELAVLAVAVVYRERLSVLIPVAVAAVLVIALTAISWHGRWLYQWLGLWLRYQARHRRRRINDEDDPGPDEVAKILLVGVVRGAEIVPVEVDAIETALISHAGGLTAVLEVTPLEAGHVVEPSHVLPPLPALLPSAEIGEPVVSAQIIIQSIPAPNFHGLADSAAISYLELAGGVVPATRGCWLALQAQHVAEEYTAADLQDTVIRSVKRLQRRLRKSGLRGRLLNGDEIASELLSLARVDAREVPATGRSRVRKKLAGLAVQESWRTWSAGPLVHTTFRLLHWPDLADPAGRELLDRLVHTPTLATTVTVAARQRPATDDVELEAAIRVTLPGRAAVDAATKEIQAIVEQIGGQVERLDGEQVFGVAATLPLGGFLS